VSDEVSEELPFGSGVVVASRLIESSPIVSDASLRSVAEVSDEVSEELPFGRGVVVARRFIDSSSIVEEDSM
jgi:hypothetical protein